VAMTAASSSTNSAALRLDTNLRYNCVNNTLSTTSFNGFLIGSCSGSSTSCSGNSATSTLASTVTVTADNTSTSLFIPLVTGGTTSEIKVDQGLSYNAVTNTLSTTNGSFSGDITGSLNGTSGTSYSIYNSVTTGSINLGSSLTSGILTIGNSLCDAASSYIYGAIGGANYLFNNITTGSINIGLYITSGHIYLGGGAHTGIIHIGANNSRIRIQNQEFSIYSLNPVGSIIQMALNISPSGYLLCDGASYSISTYAVLYGAIGQTYGFGTGTFNVPNFQGAYLRGGGTQTKNSRTYTSNAPGVYQSDQVGSHSHTQNVSLNGVSSSVGSANVTTSINPNSGNTTENRVFNYCVYYYIKY
jgi:microcystin-dependent protein